MTNNVVTFPAVPGSMVSTIEPSMEGSTGVIITITAFKRDGQTKHDLTGATITGQLLVLDVDVDTVKAVDGALALVDAVNGIFSWTMGTTDVAVNGTFSVTFKATGGSEPDAFSYPTNWEVISNPFI